MIHFNTDIEIMLRQHDKQEACLTSDLMIHFNTDIEVLLKQHDKQEACRTDTCSSAINN